MGGPGGFGRGNRRGGPPMSEEDREAERKRRMEERKYYFITHALKLKIWWMLTEIFDFCREAPSRSWTKQSWPKKEEARSRDVYQTALRYVRKFTRYNFDIF